mmetsp:Transcript_40335/g.65358  ORF Transcript_40335/g.65358 Transcript_40335/m.65358 type:complete len:85 (-) Transcript_40335:52-306(-)
MQEDDFLFEEVDLPDIPRSKRKSAQSVDRRINFDPSAEEEEKNVPPSREQEDAGHAQMIPSPPPREKRARSNVSSTIHTLGSCC